MRRRRIAVLAMGGAVLIVSLTATVVAARASSPPSVTTGAYNKLRDNWDPNEPALSPSAVQSSSFGQVFSTTVSGSVYAQPLVVNGTVIVTTEKAMAYGINATTGAVEWSRSFGSPFEASTIGCTDLQPDLGSTSTPVADPNTGTVYLTTRLQTGSGISGGHWYLQAISPTTGDEVSSFPVAISGTPWNTPGVAFNQGYALQRPGLLLLDGTVYMAFASDCDTTPYRGIVAGVSTSTHAVSTMWSDESGVGTSASSQAGIWQSGAGLVSDESGRIVLTSGNGVSPQPAAADQPPPTLSESVIGLKVKSDGKIKPVQFFAPSNSATLDANDDDLGAGGPIGLPTAYFGTTAHPNLLVQVGKDGRIFLIDADNMGGFKQGPNKTDAVLQTVGPYGGVWGQPAAYGGQGGWVYVLESGGGVLRALSYGLNGKGVPQLTSAGTSSGSFGYTSGPAMVTSNGTTSGSAVVWAVHTNGGGGNNSELVAYNAIPKNGTLSSLWSAPIGTASKFSDPTAWNGRIYVGTRDGHLLAFGSSSGAAVQAAAVAFGSVPVGSVATRTVSASTPRALVLTGPVTADGYVDAAGEAPSSTTTPSTVPGPTAGPKILPPAVSSPLPGTDFSIRQPRVGSRLGAGGTFRLSVTFRPTRAGSVVAVLSIPTSEGVRTVSLSGYGAAPGLLAAPHALAFGSVTTGAGGQDSAVTFTNSWNHPETITGFGLPLGPYSVSGLPRVGSVLSAGRAVTVSVRFDPAEAGSFASALRVATDHGAVSVPVSGQAVTGFAHLVVSRGSLDLGSVPVGHSASISFEVGNDGTVALEVTRSIVPGGAFSVPVPVPEGLTIEPGTFLDQTVVFRPTEPGPTTSHYEFKTSDGQGPVMVAVTGTGV